MSPSARQYLLGLVVGMVFGLVMWADMTTVDRLLWTIALMSAGVTVSSALDKVGK